MGTKKPVHLYIPIHGIVFQASDDPKIGRAILTSLSYQHAEYLWEQFTEAVKTSYSGKLNLGREYLKGITRDYFSTLEAQLLCAEFEVSSDDLVEKSSRAVQETRLIVELLRYGAAFLPARKDGTEYYITIESPPEETEGIVAAATGDVATMKHLSSKWTEGMPLEVDDEILALWRQVGFFTAAEMYFKPAKTKFEEMLMRGIHWLSCAHGHIHQETRLVNLVTALEVLLGPDDNMERIATPLAESAALLIEEGVNERIAMKSLVKKYYSLRSKVVHGGQRQAMTHEGMRELTGIVARIIQALIVRKDEFQTKQDLLAWLERARLSVAR